MRVIVTPLVTADVPARRKNGRRKPDSAKPKSRPHLSRRIAFKTRRAEVCVGGLGALGSCALSFWAVKRPGIDRVMKLFELQGSRMAAVGRIST
jgi:hypothetical protein